MLLSQVELEAVDEALVQTVLFDVPIDFTGPGDYILVLGSSVFGYERIEKAVQVYKRGRLLK